MTLHEGTTGGHFQAFQAPSCAAFMGIISKFSLTHLFCFCFFVENSGSLLILAIFWKV